MRRKVENKMLVLSTLWVCVWQIVPLSESFFFFTAVVPRWNMNKCFWSYENIAVHTPPHREREREKLFWVGQCGCVFHTWDKISHHHFVCTADLKVKARLDFQSVHQSVWMFQISMHASCRIMKHAEIQHATMFGKTKWSWFDEEVSK